MTTITADRAMEAIKANLDGDPEMIVFLARLDGTAVVAWERRNEYAEDGYERGTHRAGISPLDGRPYIESGEYRIDWSRDDATENARART